jgi:integrase
LKYQQVRLDEGKVYLPVTKNGRSRYVILNQKSSEILQTLAAMKDTAERTRKSDYIFPSRQGTKKRPYLFDLRKTLNRICAFAGINDFTTHSLRHTYATWALASGTPLPTLQRLLGHESPLMTMRYSHVSAHDMATATENFAALIEQQIAA